MSKAEQRQHFPPTHYDGLLKRDPELFHSVKADLDTDIEGPVSSVDELPGFASYATHKRDVFLEDMSGRMSAVLGYKPEDNELLALVGEHVDLDKFSYSTAVEYQSVFNFERFGRKVFYLADALVERLAVTELDAPSDYLHLPFSACMFVVQHPLAETALGKLSGQRHPQHAPITIYAYETTYRCLRKIILAIFHGRGNRIHSLTKRELLIHPEWRIEDSLRTDWNRLYEEHPDWESGTEQQVGDYVGFQDDESIFFTAGLPFFRIIVNAILYLASNDPDIRAMASPRAEIEAMIQQASSRGKKKKLKNAAGQVSSLNGTAVGGTLQPINVHKLDSEHSGQANTGSTITRRFLVRGHWRNQPHGQGMKERKLIYIQPHFKGPEAEEVLNKPYLVR